MKRLLAILVLSALGGLLLHSQMIQGIVGGVTAATAPPAYLFHETFEGSGVCWGAYSNCDSTWTYAQNSVPTYATAPAPFQGSYSLAADDDAHTAIASFTAQNEVYLSAQFSSSSYTNATASIIARDALGNPLCTAMSWSTNEFYLDNTGGTPPTHIAATFIVDTKYYIKLRLKKGTGSNAECQAFWSADGSTWNATNTSTNGTWTAQVAQFQANGMASRTLIWDDIRVSTTDISY